MFGRAPDAKEHREWVAAKQCAMDRAVDDREPERHRLDRFEDRFDLGDEGLAVVDKGVAIPSGLDLS